MSEANRHLTPPKQPRSRRTLERIVRASLEILESGGVEALTVQAVVKRAGSSVGSFYARFGGKEDLLEYLGERVWREAADRWDEALAARDWGKLTLGELLEGSVRLLADAGRSRAAYLRALERAPATGDGAYRSFQGHVLQGVASLLLARDREIQHAEPGVAVQLGLRAALGVLDAPDLPQGEPLSAERRTEEAVRILRAYLLGEGGSDTGATGKVDFFDIWG